MFGKRLLIHSVNAVDGGISEGRFVYRGGPDGPADRPLDRAERRDLSDLGYLSVDRDDGLLEDMGRVTAEAKERFDRNVKLLDPQIQRFILSERYTAEQFDDLMRTVGFDKASGYKDSVAALNAEIAETGRKVESTRAEVARMTTAIQEAEAPGGAIPKAEAALAAMPTSTAVEQKAKADAATALRKQKIRTDCCEKKIGESAHWIDKTRRT